MKCKDKKFSPSDCLSWVEDVTSQSTAEPATEGGGGMLPAVPPSCSPPPYTSSDSTSNVSTNEQQESGFVGLVNQAMTCYLNSLLQTLYMTPEFRNALYRWEFDGSEAENKSIPYQLQRLFLQLQISNKVAVGTTELTKSFGWDSSEAWQQHDVQELCRVMFDALERKFKNTDQADLISRLYEGKLKDYVKCLECGNESAREDTFLDIPLVVRPWGSNESYGSVEEAIAAFVTPEMLDGSNQYHCERCGKKCDAHKGLRFLKLPYLLTMQLKRFDFDPVTMHRIKLNDKVTFPEILNMASFMNNDSKMGKDESDKTESSLAISTDPSTNKKLTADAASGTDVITPSVDDDEGIDVVEPGCSGGDSGLSAKELRASDKAGPYHYELFSIMVHSGSANGGHYYAYIKSFVDGQWYCFNDVQVSQITHEDIQKTYGGGATGRGYYSSAYSSSTNAYMLMYRQIEKERNVEPMTKEGFPAHIFKILKSLELDEEKEKAAKELELATCKIKLFCNHPVKKRIVEMKMKVHKDCTLEEATETAYTILDLDDAAPLENCRLVKYDEGHDSFECSFEGCEKKRMEEILEGVKSNYKFNLFLEIRKPNEEFLVYRPGGMSIKVHVVDIENGDIGDPLVIRSQLQDTVADLKNQIAQVLELPSSNMRVVLEKCFNDLKLLMDNKKSLRCEGFYRSNKVYVEYKDEEDAKVTFNQSKFSRLIIRYRHTISFIISLPKIDKETLNSLSIPPNFERISRSSPTNDDSMSDDSGFPDKCGAFSFSSEHNKSPLGVLPNSLSATQTAPSSNTSDDPQDLDEGIGDSSSSVVSFQGAGPGSGGPTAINSDQSEDSSLSSLTDSERTLVGDDLSPRNNSPDLDGQDVLESENEAHPTPGVTSRTEKSYYWDMESPDKRPCGADALQQQSDDSSKDEVGSYFKAWPYTDTDTGIKMLRVSVDKRITFSALKKELEPWVGISETNFKLYRLYSNNQEFECTRMSDDLMTYNDEAKLAVRIGRALQKGEYRVKIYQLAVNDSEPCKFLIDFIFASGMTVLQAKKKILPELREKLQQDLPLNRCRLRKKSWKNPGTIFLDHKKFEEDIPIFPNWEVFFEILQDDDRITRDNQLAILTRHWHPSTFKMDPFKELILEEATVTELKKRITEGSGVPEEHIEIAKGQGTFPCEIQLLTVNIDLDWHSNLTSLSMWPLYISEDGQVVYFRDSTEKLKHLSEEEKREISASDNTRFGRVAKTTYSPRKEKALKIYTGTSPPSSSTMKAAENKPQTSNNGSSADGETKTDGTL